MGEGLQPGCLRTWNRRDLEWGGVSNVSQVTESTHVAGETKAERASQPLGSVGAGSSRLCAPSPASSRRGPRLSQRSPRSPASEHRLGLGSRGELSFPASPEPRPLQSTRRSSAVFIKLLTFTFWRCVCLSTPFAAAGGHSPPCGKVNSTARSILACGRNHPAVRHHKWRLFEGRAIPASPWTVELLGPSQLAELTLG